MMKRKIAVTVIGFAATMALSACGNGGQESNVSASPTETPASTPTAVAEATPTPTEDSLAKTKWGSYIEDIHIAEHIVLEKATILVPPELLPPELEGTVYDANGELLTAYPDGSVVYDADGNRGFIVYDSTTQLSRAVILKDYTPYPYDSTIVDATREYSQELIMPAYVPAGYVFSSNKIDEKDGPTDYMIAHFTSEANAKDGWSVNVRYVRSISDGYGVGGGVTQLLEADGHQIWIEFPNMVEVQLKDTNIVFTIAESPESFARQALTIDEALKAAMTLMPVQEMMEE